MGADLNKFLKENWLMILAIVYVFFPLDIIPDAVPILGSTDDALLLLLDLIKRYVKQKGD